MSSLHDACRAGDTERVKQLLDGDGSAQVDEKDEDGWTALGRASYGGQTKVVRLLLDKGALLDDGWTALMSAIDSGDTEVARLLIRKGASVNERTKALQALIDVDEEQLGRMVAAQALKHSLQGQPAARTAKTVLQLVRLTGFARDRALKLLSSDPRSADDHLVLFGRLQLAAAACAQNDESGKARGEEAVQELFNSADGRKALEHAVQIEAKQLLAQPVVQGYIKVAWRGECFEGTAIFAARFAAVLLLNLLFVLPLVALVPALEPWLTEKLHKNAYLLRLPVVKFGLECAAYLALALAFTFIPAADLATAPVAPLLLIWVGSGLLLEGEQFMAPSNSGAKKWLTRMYDRLAAYRADGINSVDAMALIFSFAALVAFLYNGEDATASTSLRATAVLLLWFRLFRVLLISPRFGPFVMMYFRMLSGDLFNFLVLLLFLLVAFAASWTVLLDSASSLEDVSNFTCAEELTAGDDIAMTFLTLLEGALTGSDFFECARNSAGQWRAAWVISFAYVTLTAVLLLNMLIAMYAAATNRSCPDIIVPQPQGVALCPLPRMAKTFDNIFEASATNYLYLFAQRTLALSTDDPPTPPPLNAVGLPCRLVYLLWGLLKSQQKAADAEAAAETETAEAAAAAAAEKSPSGNASVVLKEVVTNATANKARSTAGSMTLELPGIKKGDDATTVEKRASSLSTKKVAIESVAEANTDEEKAAEELKGAEEPKAADEMAAQGDTKKEKTFEERIAPLAKKITEHIQEYQDDSAQEQRWRTTMKRSMSKSFRLQVEAAKKQSEEIMKVQEEVQSMQERQSELVDSRFERQREEIMKVQVEVQSMQHKIEMILAAVREPASTRT
jgi:hypothetical protein